MLAWRSGRLDEGGEEEPELGYPEVVIAVVSCFGGGMSGLDHS